MTVQNFSTLSHKMQGFRKKDYEYKICVSISLQGFLKISYYKENSVRYDHKFTLVFMLSNHFSCQNLIKQ